MFCLVAEIVEDLKQRSEQIFHCTSVLSSFQLSDNFVWRYNVIIDILLYLLQVMFWAQYLQPVSDWRSSNSLHSFKQDQHDSTVSSR